MVVLLASVRCDPAQTLVVLLALAHCDTAQILVLVRCDTAQTLVVLLVLVHCDSPNLGVLLVSAHDTANTLVLVHCDTAQTLVFMLVSVCCDTSQAKVACGSDRVCVFADPMAVHGSCGLYNLGNTCFMNAGIQCLASCPPLLKHFFEQFQLTDGLRNTLTGAFYLLLCKMWSGKYSLVQPRHFKDMLGFYHPQFQDYRQVGGVCVCVHVCV